jgi:hypothetical protein
MSRTRWPRLSGDVLFGQVAIVFKLADLLALGTAETVG